MKRINEWMMLNYEQEVTIGELKATLVAQVWVGKLLKPDPIIEIEHMDTHTITFNGVSLDDSYNWKKFREFHQSMGIDYDAALDEKFGEWFRGSAFKSRILEDLADIFMGYFHTGAEDEDHLGI